MSLKSAERQSPKPQQEESRGIHTAAFAAPLISLISFLEGKITLCIHQPLGTAVYKRQWTKKQAVARNVASLLRMS